MTGLTFYRYATSTRGDTKTTAVGELKTDQGRAWRNPGFGTNVEETTGQELVLLAGSIVHSALALYTGAGRKQDGVIEQ